MREPDRVADILSQLSDLGVTLALDDFGTGYSSWTHLKYFPVRRLKVDRSFVAGLPGDRYDAAIVSATIEMAHLMGMGVTAEGVETPAQAEFLVNHGCDLLQGYLFSKAERADLITKALRLGIRLAVPMSSRRWPDRSAAVLDAAATGQESSDLSRL